MAIDTSILLRGRVPDIGPALSGFQQGQQFKESRDLKKDKAEAEELIATIAPVFQGGDIFETQALIQGSTVLDDDDKTKLIAAHP